VKHKAREGRALTVEQLYELAVVVPGMREPARASCGEWSVRGSACGLR
jgi:hypothetical protein